MSKATTDIYIGIDPGAAGCISILQGDSVTSYPLEDYNAADVLKKYCNKAICTIEEPECFGNKSNPKTLLVLGKNYGYLTGIMEAFEIRYFSVAPSKWKKHFGLTGQPKSASIDTAEILYPNAVLYRNQRCKTKHDGIADSILIADYGREILQNVRYSYSAS